MPASPHPPCFSQRKDRQTEKVEGPALPEAFDVHEVVEEGEEGVGHAGEDEDEAQAPASPAVWPRHRQRQTHHKFLLSGMGPPNWEQEQRAAPAAISRNPIRASLRSRPVAVAVPTITSPACSATPSLSCVR